MQNHTPKHVAIIMDGNGRWATQRHLPRIMGHQAGAESLKKIIKSAIENKVEILSLFAFSTENWLRPSSEVEGLMNLFLSALVQEDVKLQENGIRLRIIGDLSRFPIKLQEQIARVHSLTVNNKKMQLVVAANYGGRWDIIQAAKELTRKVKEGQLAIEEINEDLFQQHLVTTDLPAPDLFIRTSGELRISNFFLWQLAYTEFYFTDVYWPDFNEHEFELALEAYKKRERRYGRSDNTGDHI